MTLLAKLNGSGAETPKKWKNKTKAKGKQTAIVGKQPLRMRCKNDEKSSTTSFTHSKIYLYCAVVFFCIYCVLFSFFRHCTYEQYTYLQHTCGETSLSIEYMVRTKSTRANIPTREPKNSMNDDFSLSVVSVNGFCFGKIVMHTRQKDREKDEWWWTKWNFLVARFDFFPLFCSKFSTVLSTFPSFWLRKFPYAHIIFLCCIFGVCSSKFAYRSHTPTEPSNIEM